MIHSPHRRSVLPTGRVIWSESNKEIAILNMNQSVTALHAEKFLPNDDKDVLIIGNNFNFFIVIINYRLDIYWCMLTLLISEINIKKCESDKTSVKHPNVSQASFFTE